MINKEWFYERDGQSCGPVREADLELLVADDQLGATDRVWCAGMSSWHPAEAVLPRLFHERKSAERAAEISRRRREGIRLTVLYATGILVLVALFGVVIVAWMRHSPQRAAAPPVEAARVAPVKEPPPAQPVVPVQPTAPAPPRELTTKEIVARCKAAVAFVRHRQGTGSGFLVAPGLVVTNAHVVDGDLIEHCKVSFPSLDGAAEYEAQLLHKDRVYDLAVLRIRETPTKPLELASVLPEQGEKIVVIGSPGTPLDNVKTIKNAATDGTLAALNVKENGVEWYHITAAINPGNSGGPVFDGQGRVIGVATWYIPSKVAQNFAGTLPNLRAALEKTRKTLQANEADRQGAEHDLGEIYERLDLLTAAYVKGISAYAYSVMEAVKEKKDAVKEGRALLAVLDPVLAQHQRALLESFKSALPRVLANPALPPAWREDKELAELWQLFLEMKALLESTRLPALEQLAAKVNRCLRERQRLIGSLRARLGIGLETINDRRIGLYNVPEEKRFIKLADIK